MSAADASTPPASPSKAAAVPPVDVDAKLAEFAAKIEAFEAGLPDLIGQHVETVAGPILAKLVEETLTPFAERLEALTAKGEEKTVELDQRFLEHVNAKLHALHNAVQRAIGIEVPLPQLADAPGTPVGDVKVAGAETASQQP